MLTSSILIQTDDGRRFDYSIQNNRIIEDPYPQKSKFSLRPVLVGATTIAVLSYLYLLIAENTGFSSFPLAATDRKYLRRKPNIGRGGNSSLVNNTINDLMPVNDDDIDDKLRGEDDDAPDVDADFALENKRGSQSRDSYSDYEDRGVDDDQVDDAKSSFENMETNRTADSNDGLGGKEDGGDARFVDANATHENRGNIQFVDIKEENGEETNDYTSSEKKENEQSNGSNDRGGWRDMDDIDKLDDSADASL